MAEEVRLLGQQLGAAAVVVDVGGPGVRHRQGHAGHGHRLGHPHRHRQVGDRADELLPAVVGLGPVQEQDVLALVVLEEVQNQFGHLRAQVAVRGEGQHGPAGAVVDERVRVEGRQAVGGQGHEQLLDGQRARVPGVHGAVEVVQENARRHGFADRVLDAVQGRHLFLLLLPPSCAPGEPGAQRDRCARCNAAGGRRVPARGASARAGAPTAAGEPGLFAVGVPARRRRRPCAPCARRIMDFSRAARRTSSPFPD